MHRLVRYDLENKRRLLVTLKQAEARERRWPWRRAHRAYGHMPGGMTKRYLPRHGVAARAALARCAVAAHLCFYIVAAINVTRCLASM